MHQNVAFPEKKSKILWGWDTSTLFDAFGVSPSMPPPLRNPRYAPEYSAATIKQRMYVREWTGRESAWCLRICELVRSGECRAPRTPASDTSYEQCLVHWRQQTARRTQSQGHWPSTRTALSQCINTMASYHSHQRDLAAQSSSFRKGAR